MATTKLFFDQILSWSKSDSSAVQETGSTIEWEKKGILLKSSNLGDLRYQNILGITIHLTFATSNSKASLTYGSLRVPTMTVNAGTSYSLVNQHSTHTTDAGPLTLQANGWLSADTGEKTILVFGNAVDNLRNGILIVDAARKTAPAAIYGAAAAGENRPYAVIEYEEIEPFSRVVYPGYDEVVDKDNDISIRWKYEYSYSWYFELPQITGTKIRIWKKNTESFSSAKEIVLTPGATRYTVPAGTLDNDIYCWRVAASTKWVANYWGSTGIFTAKGMPTPPKNISVTSTQVHTVTWTATGQMAYEVKVMRENDTVWESGTVYSAKTSCAIEELLYDGVYSVWVRVQNDTAQWSTWTVLEDWEIKSAPVAAPTVTARAEGIGIRVTVRGEQNAYYYIYRDGLRVRRLDGPGVWMDYNVNGRHTYRAVLSSKQSYATAESEQVEAEIKLKDALLAPCDNLANPIRLRLRKGNPIARDGNLQPQGESRFCAGRSYPIYEFAEYTSEGASAAYTFRSLAELQELQTLIRLGKTMLYRNSYGDRFWCVVTGMEHSTQRRSSDFTLNMVFVDYAEEVSYTE